MYDVVIIGAGVVGASVAMELSKKKVKCLVLDKEEELCSGTSKANSGIVHSGYDAKPGSLMAKYNVEGNKLIREYSKKLSIPYKNLGSFVVCTSEDGIEKLEELKARGEKNGVEGLEIIKDRDRIFKMEPNLSKDTVAVLYASTAGIVCPFNLNIALGENAAENGVEFKFNEKVVSVEKSDNLWKVITEGSTFETKVVVNCAGVYSDEIHNMVSPNKIHITARKGEYFLLDKKVGNHVERTIFMLPNKFGKGVLISPTVDGNLILGPTAKDILDKDQLMTTKEGLEEIRTKAPVSVENLPFNAVITSFTGLRAHEDGGDFIVGEVEGAENFYDAAGIESPGLTSCIAIGKDLAEDISKKLDLEDNLEYKGERKPIPNLEHLSREEYNQLIKENSAYGNIICRCESITEGEIIEAIRRPVGARTLDGIKRRVRAGAGRCQGGFCSPKIIEILSRELDSSMSQVKKNREGSQVIIGVTK